VTFDSAAYGPKVAAILGDGHRLMDLGPGSPNKAARPLLVAFDPLADLGKPPTVREMARACLSALYLYHDLLDESHSISQDLPSATGSFLHAVMHRREPDASNAKYWWRRVGQHPVFGPLAAAAAAAGYESQGEWDPFAFVDRCEAARGRGTPDESLLRRVQLLEWQLLFDHCFRAAASSA
jgi:hypothetical protein